MNAQGDGCSSTSFDEGKDEGEGEGKGEDQGEWTNRDVF